jgi:hypothetical protein
LDWAMAWAVQSQSHNNSLAPLIYSSAHVTSSSELSCGNTKWDKWLQTDVALCMIVPNPFGSSCTFKLSFLHQFCKYWLEIKKLNSHICNLSAWHMICCNIVIFLFCVLGCQRVVYKVKRPSVAEVCLWKAENLQMPAKICI